MARKWKSAIIIWVCGFLPFWLGSFIGHDADLVFLSLWGVFVLVGSTYIVVNWLHGRSPGECKPMIGVFSLLPRSWYRFYTDETEENDHGTREGR
jgi:hypothetical protein